MARPRQFEEAAVVHAAMQVFWQQGFQSTSIQQLVDATGLKRGSLYGAFGDKRGLFLAALDLYATTFIAAMRTRLEQTDDPVEALRDFVRQSGIDGRDPERLALGCLMGKTCGEQATDDAAIRARVDRFVTDLQGVMADGLRRGQAMGLFDPDRDADAVALFIQCTLQGRALLGRARAHDSLTTGVIDELLRLLS